MNEFERIVSDLESSMQGYDCQTIYHKSTDIWIEFLISTVKPETMKNIDQTFNLLKTNPSLTDFYYIQKLFMFPINLRSGLGFNLTANEIRTIILISFLGAAIVCCIYWLNQSKNVKNSNYPYRPSQGSDKSDDQAPDLSYSSNTKTSSGVLLVLLASKIDLIQTIRNHDGLTDQICKDLYNATEYLVQGSSQELQGFINSVSGFQTTNPTQNDIYLIKIDLVQYEPRFEEGINDLARLRAFEQLPTLIKPGSSIQVSEPLKLDAWNQFNLYR